MKRLYILGAGGLCSVLIDQILTDPAHHVHWRLMGVVDDRDESVTNVSKYSVNFRYPLIHYLQVSQIDELDDCRFMVSIGDPVQKELYVTKALRVGAEFVSCINTELISQTSEVGASVIGKDTIISASSRLADHCFVDSRVTIGHNVTIEDYCHIGVNVVISGGVRVRSKAAIMSGAVIGQDIEIGEASVIGVGAVVTRDVAPGDVMIGNPAQSVRRKIQL